MKPKWNSEGGSNFIVLTLMSSSSSPTFSSELVQPLMSLSSLPNPGDKADSSSARSVESLIVQNQAPENAEQENMNVGDSSARNVLEMPTTSTEGERPPSDLRMIVPPSAYCSFSTVPATPLYTLPALNTSNLAKESSQASGSSAPSPSLDTAPSSSSDSNNMDSPILASHFASTSVTPDTCDIVTVNTSTSNTSFAIESRASLMDAPKVPEANLRAFAGSSWLTDLGGNTKTDHVFRNIPGAVPSLSTQSSPVSSLNSSLASPASSFPHALLPSVSISLTSTPVSSPSASSSLRCTSLVFPENPARLTLLSTSTAAFPFSIDTLERWREDITVQMSTPETVPQTPSVDHADSIADRTEHTDFSLPPGSNQREANLRTTRSKRFLQKVKKIGGRVGRFVLAQRSKPHGAVEADASSDVNTRPRSNNGSVVVISTSPSPYDKRPSRPIPHSPEQLRSLSMFSPHSLWVRGNAYESIEGATEVRPQASPVDARGRQEFPVRKTSNRRFSLSAFSSRASFRKL